MKVIDLLNKIANGEEVPKKFMYDDREFYLQSKDCWRCDDAIFEECFILEDLNKDIEIIEEDKPKTLNNIRESYGLPRMEDKKIEKLDQRIDTGLFGSMVNDEIKVAEAINKQANYMSDIVSKINEIIDYLEENK